MDSKDGENKRIVVKGTSNRYLMKKVMKVEEKVDKKRQICEKWNLSGKSFENSMEVLSNLEISTDLTDINKTIIREIERKIASYKQQDIEKRRFDSLLFVSLERVIELLKEVECKCFYCQEGVMVLYEKVREKKQWTLDRINNDLGHNHDNVIISCLECNLKRRRLPKDGFLFTKQMVLIKTDP